MFGVLLNDAHACGREPAATDDGNAAEGAILELPLTLAPGRVFSPHATTELLVHAALERMDGRPMRVADVGTGSGAIALALAVHRPQIEVWAVDTNRVAVQLAHENSIRNGVGDRVHILHGDLLAPVPGPVDLIVANLPYLPASVRRAQYDIEPDEAIYAPGDGLAPYRRLLTACRDGKLASPDGAVLIALHGEVLTARARELDDLRVELEDWLPAAA
jgi:release factor glutamine methyltransferase